jgi:hypothetical protein
MSDAFEERIRSTHALFVDLLKCYLVRYPFLYYAESACAVYLEENLPFEEERGLVNSYTS